MPSSFSSPWRPAALAVFALLSATVACKADPKAAAASPAGAASTAAAPAGGMTPASAPAGTAAAGAPAAATAEKVDPAKLPAVVAHVNGKEIGRDALVSAAKAMAPVAARAGQPTDTRDFYRQVLDDLVSAELMRQDAVAQGMNPSDAEVEAQVKQVTARFPSEAELQKALASENMTPAILRDQVKENLAVQKLIQTKIAPQATVDEAAQKKFYEENKARMMVPEQVRVAHILIATPQGATADQQAAAKKKAQDLLAQIRKGGDFGALAKANSEDPGSKDHGGELPWLAKGQTVPAFEAAAFALPVGQVSEVVQTQFGFHIIKSLERKAATTRSYEEVAPRLKEMLTQQKVRDLVQAHVAGLRGKAKIDIAI